MPSYIDILQSRLKSTTAPVQVVKSTPTPPVETKPEATPAVVVEVPTVSEVKVEPSVSDTVEVPVILEKEETEVAVVSDDKPEDASCEETDSEIV